MKVLACYAVKGGVGKTAAAINLAWLAARDGNRTLLWDLDAQAAATFLLRAKPKVKGGKKISTDEKAEINGYIKEMEALRDEQASKQATPPAVTPVAPVAPVQPIQPAQPEGPPPGYTAQPAGAYPGQGAPGYQSGADQQPPSGALVAQPAQPEPASSGPVYTKWWFWTIVGAVVVGGIVTAVALSSGGTSKPPCTALICE